MPKGNYLKNMVLDTIAVNGTFTKPTTLYLALYTSDPTNADTGTELVSYTRLAIANNGTTFSRTGNVASNTAALAFAERTGAAAVITHVGLRTALTGGSLLYHEILANPITVSANVPTTITLAIGAVTLTEI